MVAVAKPKKAKKASPRPKPKPAPSSAEVRRDDSGGYWSAAAVEREILDLVRAIDPNAKRLALKRATTFSGDLGWDDWFKLSVLKPVRKRFHESLSATVVLDRVRTVGDLVDYIWASMGPA